MKARETWLVSTLAASLPFDTVTKVLLQAKRDAAILHIRANLETEILKMEKAAERLASLAGSRFDERSKAHGKRHPFASSVLLF